MVASKGSAFEREVCKVLSKWWTYNLRDDIFWRCSQSGGRATQRAKSGQRTFGSYGDIAAVDPIGQPLLKLFTIELKRGRSHGSAGDLLDHPPINHKHKWVQCLLQAITAHEQAGSGSWMLICRRDRRLSTVYLESRVLRLLRDDEPMNDVANIMRLQLTIRGGKGPTRSLLLVGLPLATFLKNVEPRAILKVLKRL